MEIDRTHSKGFFHRVSRWFTKQFIQFGKPSVALNTIFNRILLDQPFTQEQLAQVAKCLNVSYFEKGDVIFKEGDLGDVFYFIVKGSVTIFNTHDNIDVVVARLEPGDFFGEQALLEESPGRRMASAKASDDCELLTLSHIDYVKILNPEIKEILKRIGDKHLFEMFCKTQEVLGSIKESVLKEYFGLVLEFKDGEMIFQAGDPSDRAYFILSGKVVIEFVEEKGVRKVELGKGSLFGELGVLNSKKRSGAAYAKGDVKLLGYDEKDFKKLYDASSDLQQYVKSMKSVYQIKSHHAVNLYFGKFLEVNSVIAVYNLEDGSTVSAAKAIGNLFFTMSHSDSKDSNIFSYIGGSQTQRKLGIKNHKIMSVSSLGNWEELREICNLILNRETISDENIQSFINSGNLGLSKLKIFTGDERKEILCPCMNISKEEVCAYIARGINKTEDIIQKTGAGSVCGVCLPKIVELFGLKAWTTVKLVKKTELRPNVAAFQFVLVDSQKFNYNPGQYVILSAMINGQFISRTYTLTSVSGRDPYIEMIVQMEKKGYFSPWLFENANEDSLIRVSNPGGDFILPTDEQTPVVCFVEGIRVTPAIAFARNVAQKSIRRLHIDYSEKTKSDFILVDELNTISSNNKNITIQYRATQEEKEIQPEQIQKIVSDFPNAEFYICTLDPLREFICSQLIGQKVSPDKIKMEKFIYAGGSV